MNFSVKNLFDDKHEERRLDGSRDYYFFRENGRFGSHSVYDDMEDGSFS